MKEVENRNREDRQLLSPNSNYMCGEIVFDKYVRYFCLINVQSDNCLCPLPIPTSRDSPMSLE